jgi:hypothetical protein
MAVEMVLDFVNRDGDEVFVIPEVAGWINGSVKRLRHHVFVPFS